jgi:hypothetical protein
MNIPNYRLNSTATEFQSEEGRTANQNMVVREQIDSPGSRECVRPKSWPGPRVQSISTFIAAGKASENYQNELSGSFISHQQVFFFLISSPRPLAAGSHIPRSAFPALTCSAQCPTRTANCPHPAPLNRRESASMCPRDDVLPVAAALGGAHPQPSSFGQHLTMRQGGDIWHRLGAGAAKSASAHRIGRAAIGR